MIKKFFILAGAVSLISCAQKTPSSTAKSEGAVAPKPAVPAPPPAEFVEKPPVSSARSPEAFRELVDDTLRSIESNPRDYDAYMRLGSYYMQLNQSKKAARAFENASLVRSNATEPMIELARVYSESGEGAKAVQLHQELVRRDPKNWMLRNNLAVAYRRKGDFESASAIIRELLNADKTNIYAINNLGLIYYDTKRYQLAELTFQKGKKINQQTAETYNNLGLTYIAMDLTKNALNEFRKAAELNPRLIAPRMNLGDIFLEYQNYPLAIAAYKEVLDVEPLHLNANQNIGVAYMATGKVAEARQALARVAELDPQNSGVFLNLGMLYQNNLQDGETALKYYQRFVAIEGSLSPKHVVYNYIAQAKSMAKRPPKAVEAAPAKPGSDSTPDPNSKTKPKEAAPVAPLGK